MGGAAPGLSIELKGVVDAEKTERRPPRGETSDRKNQSASSRESVARQRTWERTAPIQRKSRITRTVERAPRESLRRGLYGAQIAGDLTGIPAARRFSAPRRQPRMNIAGSPAGMAAGGAIAGVGLAIGAVDLLKEVSEASRATVNLSKELERMSIGQARQFEQVAKLTGVSVGAFTTGERQLSQALEDGTGRGKNAAESLQRLGIAMVDVKETSENPELCSANCCKNWQLFLHRTGTGAGSSQYLRSRGDQGHSPACR